MGKRTRMFLALLSLAMLLSFNAGASIGGFALEAMGVRPLAMGSAYSALADDAAAVLWNPAGLVQVKGIQAEAVHADPFQMNIAQTGALAAFPFRGYTLGAAFSQLDESAALGFPYSERVYALGLGGKLSSLPQGSWGVTNKIYALKGGSESLNLAALTYCVDLGVLSSYKSLRLAAVIRDLPLVSTGKLNIDGAEEHSKLKIGPQLRLAAAYAWNRWTFSGELSAESGATSLAAGIERSLSGGLALRAGVAPESATFGFGVDKGRYTVNYAYKIHPVGSSQRLSMGYKW